MHVLASITLIAAAMVRPTETRVLSTIEVPATCLPPIEWQHDFTGADYGWLYSLQQTGDGGYIVGGERFWVARLDASGAELWARTYGGNFERLTSLKQTADGGFILGGFSNSGTNAYKTAPLFGGLYYGDFWVVRLDAEGNKLWDHSFGGSADDVLNALEQTSDGGFILGGYSYSQADGNKTSFTAGSADLWIVRLDANGHKLWERSFGSPNFENLFSLQQTADGGFILGGFTYSGGNGSPFNTTDGWVIRLDANGMLLWDRMFGSIGYDAIVSVRQTRDQGFILGGHNGISDALVIRLDSAGETVWERSFGNGGAVIYSIRETSDGGFVFGATSGSPAGGSKSSPNLGGTDFWIVRLDSNGAKQWEQTYGTDNYDYIAGLELTADGGFVFGGSIGIGSRVIKLRPELPCDRDGDGIPDIHDLCPDTPSGQIVNADGCSLDQLVPCLGPWKNHGDYLAAMKNATAQFVRDGLLTREQQLMLLRQAAQSGCGGK